MSTSSNTNDPPPPSCPSQWRHGVKEGTNIKRTNTTGQWNVHDLEKTKVHRELSNPGRPGAVSIDNAHIDQSQAVKGNTQRAASPRSTTTTEETQESQRLVFLKRKLEDLDNDLNFGGRDLRYRVRSDRDILRERAEVSAEIKREERTSWMSATNLSCSAISKSVSRYLGAYRLNSGLGVAIIVAIGASGCAALLVRGGFLVGIANAAGGYMMRSPMDEVHGMEETDRRHLAEEVDLLHPVTFKTGIRDESGTNRSVPPPQVSREIERGILRGIMRENEGGIGRRIGHNPLSQPKRGQEITKLRENAIELLRKAGNKRARAIGSRSSAADIRAKAIRKKGSQNIILKEAEAFENAADKAEAEAVKAEAEAQAQEIKAQMLIKEARDRKAAIDDQQKMNEDQADLRKQLEKLKEQKMEKDQAALEEQELLVSTSLPLGVPDGDV